MRWSKNSPFFHNADNYWSSLLTQLSEAASTGRAGCSNKECKDNKVKIAKGELRVGSWVENEKFQSWTWRHW